MTGGATFGLIAGGCHNAWAWDKLIKLKDRGYDAVAPLLPTDDPKAGLSEYVDAVAAGLAGVSGPIILVGLDPETAEWAKSRLQAQGSGPMMEAFPAGGWPAGVLRFRPVCVR